VNPEADDPIAGSLFALESAVFAGGSSAGGVREALATRNALAVGLVAQLLQPGAALLELAAQRLLRGAPLGLELVALLLRAFPQLVGLSLGEREDVRGAAGGALAHVVDLVLGDAHHLLQALAHPVDGVRDRRQLGDLRTQLVRLRPPLRAVGPGRLDVADARLQPPREDLGLCGGGLTRRDRRPQLRAQHVDLLVDLGAVVSTADDGELGLVGNGHQG